MGRKGENCFSSVGWFHWVWRLFLVLIEKGASTNAKWGGKMRDSRNDGNWLRILLEAVEEAEMQKQDWSQCFATLCSVYFIRQSNLIETDGIRKLYLWLHAALDRNQFIMLTSTNFHEDHVHHQSAQAVRSRHIPHGNIVLQSHFPTFVCRCS